MTRVELSTPCVETTRRRNGRGYGLCDVTRFGKRIQLAHVLAWIDANGRLPAPGMQINHHCDNPPCIHPGHLYEGSHADNMRDRAARRRHWETKKTHCPRGHAYDEANTYVSRDGHRTCKACQRRPGAVPQRDRTHCPQGHPYDETNTYVSPKGERFCRTCKRARRP